MALTLTAAGHKMAVNTLQDQQQTCAEDDKKLLDFCTNLNNALIRGMVLNEKIDVHKLGHFREGHTELKARHAWANRLVDSMEIHFHAVSLLRKFQDGREEADTEVRNRLLDVQKRAMAAMDNMDESIDDFWQPLIEECSEHLSWITNRASQLQHEASFIPRLRDRLQHHTSADAKIKLVPLFSVKNRNLVLKKGEVLLLVNNVNADVWKVQNPQSGQIYQVPSLMLLMLGPNEDCVNHLNAFQENMAAAVQKTMTIMCTDLAYSLKINLKRIKRKLSAKLQLPSNDKRLLQDSLVTIRRIVDNLLKSTMHYPTLNTHLITLEQNVSKASRTFRPSTDVEDVRNELANIVNLMTKLEGLMVHANQVTAVTLTIDDDESYKLVEYRRPRPIIDNNNKGSRRVYEMTYIMKEIQRKEEVTYVSDNTVETPKDAVDHVSFRTPDGWTHFDDEASNKVATTFQVLRSQGEQTTKFIIEGVIDPRTNEMISMEDAINDGILIQEQGEYCDITTGISCPIPEAMNDGRIVMTIKEARASEEPSTSFGMVSVKKTVEGKRSYKIHHVVHPITGEVMTFDEAVKEGIINESGSIYTNPKSGNELIVAEARKKKLVYAEPIGDDDDSDEAGESDMKHYVISSVVDRRLKRRVSFRQATMTGLIDRETGAYIDSVTGKRVYVADAIGRGLLKAKQIDDPNDIDVEPDNTMYVEKVEQIKKKLLRPLQVISMFKAQRDKAKMKNVIKEEEIDENGL